MSSTKLVRVSNNIRGKKLISSDGNFEEFLSSVRSKFELDEAENITFVDEYGAEVDSDVFPILVSLDGIQNIIFKLEEESSVLEIDLSYNNTSQSSYFLPAAGNIGLSQSFGIGDNFKQILQTTVQQNNVIHGIVEDCKSKGFVDDKSSTILINEFVSKLIEIKGKDIIAALDPPPLAKLKVSEFFFIPDIKMMNVESIVRKDGDFTPIWKPSLATEPAHVAEKSSEATWLRLDGGVMRTQSLNIFASPAPTSSPFNETDALHYVVKIYSTREFQNRVALQWNISEPFNLLTPTTENSIDLKRSSNPWRVDVTMGQCEMQVNWGDSSALSKLSCLEMGFQFRKIQRSDEKKNVENLSPGGSLVELLFTVYGTITCIILFHFYHSYSRTEFLP
ncbi:hypothetical protein Fcan01_26908 [Folsomia candida]|uniref:Uncharacterized protein n=1 Tax=Folsomia candida TaxID=158441 RepID=A0A226CZL7_FOLCA|nr:hypothetical protein Fcan01_26908 [Folsomia candida]